MTFTSLHCRSKDNLKIFKTKLPIFCFKLAPFTVFFISVSDVSLPVVQDNTLAVPLASLTPSLSIPGLGLSPGEVNGYPLQYSGLENSMDYIVHGVTESDTNE